MQFHQILASASVPSRSFAGKKKIRAKNGESRILDGVSPVATFRVRIIDKLDEACTNVDDRMML